MTPAETRALNEQVQRAYHGLFGSPAGQIVLADLVAYCHGRKTTFDPDARVHAFKAGQHDVLMRITEFTNLSIEEIYRLRGPAIPRGTPTEETDQ